MEIVTSYTQTYSRVGTTPPPQEKPTRTCVARKVFDFGAFSQPNVEFPNSGTPFSGSHNKDYKAFWPISGPPIVGNYQVADEKHGWRDQISGEGVQVLLLMLSL